MAKTLAARLEAVILDEQEIEAKAIVYALIDPSAAFSDVISTLDTWLADLDACTDGQITSSRLELLPALPGGLKAAPAAGSRVEQTGDLSFNDVTGAHLNTFLVPALSNDPGVISGGRIVLTSGSPAANLRDLLAGGGTAALEWSNAWQQALTTFASALISFREHRVQLGRATYERA